MAIPKLEEDLAIIAKMPDNPRADGLTTEAFKAQFDRAALTIQKYINDVLVPAVEVGKSGGIVLGPKAPSAGPVLWLNTDPRGTGAEVIQVALDQDISGHAVIAQVDGTAYGMENFTANQGPAPGKYDFTVK